MEAAAARPKVDDEVAEMDAPSDPFTAETLRAALAIRSPRIVKELYEIVQRRIAYESGRQQRLDSKATSLLTASGVSVTLAFSFLGVMSSKDGGATYHAYFNWMLLAFGFAIISGLAAASFAIASLFVTKGYKSPNDEHIFDAEKLRAADSQDPEEGTEETEALVDEWRLMKYQKWLIEQYWDIADSHSKTHDRKARIIQRGQIAFVGFLGSIALVCFLAGLAIYSHHDHGQAAARPAASAQGSAQGAPRGPSGQ